jgi:hypothetical protein
VLPTAAVSWGFVVCMQPKEIEAGGGGG